MRIHHIAIKSKDPDRLASFYSGELGLPEQKRHQDEQGLRSVWLTLGDAILMIERASDGDPPPYDRDPPGLHLLALTIDPATAPAWRAKLPIRSETAYTLYFADPEGNRLALSSYPEPLAR